jgi:ATP-dependent DNA helicase RecG
LHQLRGRIGRGQYTSYCILMPGEDTPEAREKLGVLEQTTDGFAVAEADLRLRGPGDMLGTAQTGLPPLRLGDLFRDGALIQQARDQAAAIFEQDVRLVRPEHAPLREWLAKQDIAALGG